MNDDFLWTIGLIGLLPYYRIIGQCLDFDQYIHVYKVKSGTRITCLHDIYLMIV